VKLAYKSGVTSVILRVMILDSTSTTGGQSDIGETRPSS